MFYGYPMLAHDIKTIKDNDGELRRLGPGVFLVFFTKEINLTEKKYESIKPLKTKEIFGIKEILPEKFIGNH